MELWGMTIPEVIIVAIVSGLFGLAGGYFSARANRPKVMAETEKAKANADASEADAAKTWAETNILTTQQLRDTQVALSEEVAKRTKLEKQVNDLLLQLEGLRGRVAKLERQVIDLGGKPEG